MRRRVQPQDVEEGYDANDLEAITSSNKDKDVYEKLREVQNKNNELENTIYSLRYQLNAIKKENRKNKFSVDYTDNKDKVI